MKFGFAIFNRGTSAVPSASLDVKPRFKPMSAFKRAVSDLGVKVRQACASVHTAKALQRSQCQPDRAGFRRVLAAQAVKYRKVSVSAHPDAPGSHEFPFQVNYHRVNVRKASQAEFSFDDPTLRASLRVAIQGRQGIFEWARAGTNSLRQQLQELIKASESVQLGDGFVVHGLSENSVQGDVHHWQLLVSAPATDRPGEMDTFQVPLTEMRVPSRHVPSAGLLNWSEQALKAHLLNVDMPYRDGVDNPLMLSTGCHDLADLHALQIEMTSRIQAGLIDNHLTLSTTLQQMAPDFLERKNVSAVRRLLPALQEQLEEVALNPLPLSPSVLASKRHFPVNDLAKNSDVTTGEPNRLTLVGKVPLLSPSELGAFRQKPADNHCGVVSVNGFFQAEVMRGSQAVNHILANYARVLGVESLTEMNLPGLYHPSIIGAMQRGDSVVITRKDFLGSRDMQAVHARFDALYVDTPVEQWDALCNYKFQGGQIGKNTSSFEVTPDLWLSAAGGIHADSLESILNTYLQTKPGSAEWSAYPDQVARIPMREPLARRQFEGQIDRLIRAKNSNTGNNTLFPMVCMTRGHYFAVVRTDKGSWLKLDSNGTKVTGVQDAEIFARHGSLREALQAHDVQHVICEPLHP